MKEYDCLVFVVVVVVVAPPVAPQHRLDVRQMHVTAGVLIIYLVVLQIGALTQDQGREKGLLQKQLLKSQYPYNR